MPTVWVALKRSLHCNSKPSDVHDPKPKNKTHLKNPISTRKNGRSGCSKSIENLKDVINGSKTHLEKPPSFCSPRSIGSNEFINPLTHEVFLNNSKCELKITNLHSYPECSGGGSNFVDSLSPGDDLIMNHRSPSPRSSVTKSLGFPQEREGPGCGNSSLYPGGGDGGGDGGGGSSGGSGSITSKLRVSYDIDSHESSFLACHKCGVQLGKRDAAEAHHLSKHAVTELVEGDSSRKIVEIICKINELKSESNSIGRVERILKVHNMQKTLVRFEQYREMVKFKATTLEKKHPRCLADGNELLRFYGTTIECSLGISGYSSICVSDKCGVCCIIRNGFSTKNELKGRIGIFTTSTSERAYESIESDENSSMRKALIVCRVVAGRVHKPLENYQELVGQTGFDSVAGKMGVHSHIEELHLLNPRALLPCFVIIYKS